MRKSVGDIIITVEADGSIESRNLIEDISLDDGQSFDEYLVEAAAIVAWWNHKYKQVENMVRRQKVNIERIKAELDRSFREELEDNDEKYTDTKINRLIELDPRYQKEVDKLLDYEETLGYLKAAVEALREKRSALINLGANMRTEYTHPAKFSKEREDKSDVSDIAEKFKRFRSRS